MTTYRADCRVMPTVIFVYSLSFKLYCGQVFEYLAVRLFKELENIAFFSSFKNWVTPSCPEKP